MPLITNYREGPEENYVDLGTKFVTKEYLMDVYPNLSSNVKMPGLFVWGYNASGAVGDNTIVNKSSPIQTVATDTTWKQVSSGAVNATPPSNNAAHSAGIKTDGTLWLWGYNLYGELGDNTTTHRSSPVQVSGGGTTWKQVACGYVHTAAVKTDGTLWTWGYAGYGQLGNNVTATNTSAPAQTVSNVTTWNQVSCGYLSTAAIKTDGTLWVWGNNSYGELGNNNLTVAGVSSPIQTVTGGTNWKQVSAGVHYVNAIKTDGTLWGWGYNPYGQVGDGTTLHRSSPVQTTAGGTNWKQLSGAAYHCFAIKTDGTLWGWGYNPYGNLGINSTSHKSSPVQTIVGGTNWKTVGTLQHSTIAIKTDGTLWMWGLDGNYGYMGDNTGVSKSSPVQITNLTSWKDVCRYSAGATAMAILDFGDL